MPPKPDLTNNPTCMHPVGISIGPGEENQWAAARLTPSSYPMTIQSIQYLLLGSASPAANDPHADNGLAHAVEVYVANTDAPPATPTVLKHWDIPASTKETTDKLVKLDLAAPIMLNAGENLYVAVQMTGTITPPDPLYLGACQGPSFKSNANYWSNATTPPYPWATLESFGFQANYQIDAFTKP
jgi:hypothetical protein